MRALIGLAALAALTVPSLTQESLAQQARPPGQRPAQRQQAQPPAPPAPPPGFFPCRTEGEVCYIGVVAGPSQIAVLFTNDQKAEGIEAKPVDLSSAEAPGTALDLAGSLGRVVMVTGTYAQASGITKAQVVDTASPLLSFMMKQSAGGDEGQAAPQQRGGGRPARR
ncbi:MAG TPA: hypothetical protein VF601_19735 [Beijerinckiaceae bacterium]|jgi:hypothetical protein